MTRVCVVDDTVAVAGDLFEAETDCVNDLGQAPPTSLNYWLSKSDSCCCAGGIKRVLQSGLLQVINAN